MVNYSNSIIYKLCCNDTAITDIYVGSTTNFRNRKRGHKEACHNAVSKSYNIYVYQFIREHGGWDAWDMVQIEPYNATDKRALHTRERYWIETLKPSLNKVIPTRTIHEYHDDNKERIAGEKKQYRENNKDRKRAKQNTKVDCDCCSTYTYANKQRHIKSQKHKFYQQTYNFIYL